MPFTLLLFPGHDSEIEMTDAAQLLARAIERFDEVNARDPRTTPVGEREEPTELVYARRMTVTLDRFAPGASDELRLAIRAQHISRWSIPRSEFPPGRSGYKAWRTRLMDHHAELAAGILRDVGYGEPTVERVGQLLRKRGLKRDPEVQTLEDVVCLVFLEYYFEEFAAQHEDDKLVEILRKTWAKMSERGRTEARGLELGARGKKLLARALGE